MTEIYFPHLFSSAVVNQSAFCLHAAAIAIERRTMYDSEPMLM
jgi:hypothetical protein